MDIHIEHRTDRTRSPEWHSAALRGDVVTQGHADYCTTNGHATYKVDNVDQGMCPRCGEVTTVAGDPTIITRVWDDQERITTYICKPWRKQDGHNLEEFCVDPSLQEGDDVWTMRELGDWMMHGTSAKTYIISDSLIHTDDDQREWRQA